MTNLPPITIYREYLEIASKKLNIPIQECRDRYGLYTTEQWQKLLEI